MATEKELLMRAFENHESHGAVMGLNFVECERCQFHAHSHTTPPDADSNREAQLWRHWGNEHDNWPITELDDPRLSRDFRRWPNNMKAEAEFRVWVDECGSKWGDMPVRILTDLGQADSLYDVAEALYHIVGSEVRWNYVGSWQGHYVNLAGPQSVWKDEKDDSRNED